MGAWSGIQVKKQNKTRHDARFRKVMDPLTLLAAANAAVAAVNCETGGTATSKRLLAYTIYLNDVEEGGETEFLYYPKRIKAKKGTLCLFPCGFTHTHRGNPPISNIKYIATGWIEF